MYVSVYLSIYPLLDVWVFTFWLLRVLYIYIYICMYMCVCVCVHTHIHICFYVDVVFPFLLRNIPRSGIAGSCGHSVSNLSPPAMY